jgi:hypothetical protein
VGELLLGDRVGLLGVIGLVLARRGIALLVHVV